MTDLLTWIYIYCTDFTITLANFWGLTYYDVNALIFCIIWPLVTAGLLLSYFYQRKRARKNT
jgi:hypothetical protein